MIRKERVAMIAGVAAILAGLLLLLLEVESPLVILIGAIIGAVYGLPIGLLIELKRFQWLIVFLLMLLVPAAGLFHWAAPLFLLAVIVATVYMASHIMAPLFGGVTRDAFIHLAKLNLGIWRGFHIIEDGDTAFPKGGGRSLGPLLAILRPNNVAVMEGGTTQPRVIVGPKIGLTERFEFVKQIFDLKPTSKQMVFKGCLTSDGSEVDITIKSLAGLNISDQTRREPEKITSYESTFLHKLHMDMPDWEAHFASKLEQATRQIICKYTMMDLQSNVDSDAIALNIQRYLNSKLTTIWGIKTLELTIERIALPSSYVKANAEASAAALTMQILSSAKSDGLGTLARGYKVAKDEGMPDDLIRQELVGGHLEQMAQEPGVGALLSPALSAALREMLESMKP